MAESEKQPASDAIVHQESLDNEAPPLTEKDAMAEAAARGQGLDGYEDLTVWETIKVFKMNSLICSLVAISTATDGYQIGLIGNLIANPGFVRQFGNQIDASGKTVLSSSVISNWGLVGSISQIIGMLGLPFVTDRFGRKFSMYLYWLFIALGLVVECVGRDHKVWYASKVLGGLGVGCLQTTVPGYITEVAPVRARGVFLTSWTMWWVIGQFFAPVALQVLSKKDPYDYLTPIYTQWSQVGLMLIIYLFVPESPVWCVNHGKPEQAKAALRYINKGTADFDIEHAYNLLLLNIEHENQVAAEQRSQSWWSIFKGRDGIRTLCACVLPLSGFFIGLGVFFTYGSYFFQQVGMKDPFMITCITSSINIAATIVVVFVSDVVGRRPLGFYGVTLCVLCNIGVGILGVVPKGKATKALLVLFSCLWNVGLVTMASASWSLVGEIPSARLRHYTTGFSAASGNITGLGLGYLVPYMLNAAEWNWGLKTCWFFAGVGAPFVVATWFLVPETRHRTSGELDELFERKIKPYRFHKTTSATQRVQIDLKSREQYEL
ncbi:general substrate transporter [Leptodontidium sp. MPI-SDFR-AT-0119]|nr:general substrate transporter [Leptodontidium sp. MPI-SDFR-AT-0119]